MEKLPEERYIVKNQEQLKAEYKLVSIYMHGLSRTCPLGAGHRYAYWVVGDGEQTLLYYCGHVVVLNNRDFVITEVNGKKAMNVEGRIKFQSDLGEWLDLGPFSRSGFDHTDPDFDSVRRTLLSNVEHRRDFVQSELTRLKKSGELDSVFSSGGSFDDDGF